MSSDSDAPDAPAAAAAEERAPPPAPSREQQAVISAVVRGSPLTIIDSVAGAGKTTCLLSLAAALPQCRVLQITYNSALKSEVRAKAAERGLTNVNVHTYHSLCTKFYDSAAYTDERIYRMLHQADPSAPLPPPIRRIVRYDIVCIDEIQDMTGLYYKLVWRFLSDMPRRPGYRRGGPQIVVLGDRYQGVYGFKQADTRYLTMARYIFHVPTVAPAAPSAEGATAQASPTTLRMSTSYRVTIPIANFINRYMLKGSDRLRSVKPGPPVDYIRADCYLCVPRVFRLIQAALADGSATPSDIFVLCTSVKRHRSPVRMLENFLVLAGIPCYAPLAEDCALDDAVLAGKCVLTTLCQSKGRERKLVIVFGFDRGYFKYFERTAPPDECTSGLYVGTTRASHRLIVVEDIQQGPLPFLTLAGMADDPDVRLDGLPFAAAPEPAAAGDADACAPEGDEEDITDPLSASSDSDAPCAGPGEVALHRTTVTDLTRFVKTSIVAEISNQFAALFRCVQPAEPTRTADIATKVRTAPGRYEEVSDITGLALTALWECQESGRCTMDRLVRLQASMSGGDFSDAPLAPGAEGAAAECGANDDAGGADDAEAGGAAGGSQRRAGQNRVNYLIETLPRVYSADHPDDFLKLAVVYQCYMQGYLFKAAQITRYDWLQPADIAICMGNLAACLRDDAALAYEYNVLVPERIGDSQKFKSRDPFVFSTAEYGDIQISAILDALTSDSVYEFKMTSSLTIDHYIQVIVYAWIWSQTQAKALGPRRFYLLNIRTSEQWELIATPSQIENIALALIRNKYEVPVPLTDSEFIAESLHEARTVAAAAAVVAAPPP